MNPLVVSLLTLAAIAFMLWFTFGTQRNIRRGNSLVTWLQGGLPLLGKKASLRWLGSSAVELTVADARAPFRSAVVLIVLEPRDLGWLWAATRRRGRRDFLVLRGRLRTSPAFELEAGDPSGWTGRDRLDRIDWTAWDRGEWGAVEVAYTRDADLIGVRRLWDKLDAVSGGMWRLSVRRDEPHVEVHLRPPDPETADAADLLKRIRELAVAVGSGR